MTGHPAHQMRDFKVTVKNDRERVETFTVTRQTRDDAVLLTGMILGAGPERAQHWIVTGVHDPADPGGAS
jgi:hypothetical protein